MRAYIGIDPGMTGAIACLVDVAYDGLTYESVIDVPITAGKYDFYKMYKHLGRLVEDHEVSLTLEQQQAMPKQGVSSTFKTGLGYGAWQALCSIVTPDYEIVSPRKWKKALGLTSDKEESRKLAIKLYPGMEEQLSRKKDHNRAEALLLAHYTKLNRS